MNPQVDSVAAVVENEDLASPNASAACHILVAVRPEGTRNSLAAGADGRRK